MVKQEEIQDPASDSQTTKQPPVNESEAKAGSSVATLWLKIHQDNQPPASIPSTLFPLENCPCCHHVLSPPLKSPERQVCGKCGWSNQPSQTMARQQAVCDQQSDMNLLRLLEQAASESLENMKPRKNRKI